ncbi:MAG: hypothetical protein U0414_22120 [Polyangiaceae bacterium]
MRRAPLFALLLAGCATLADGHAGLENPPSARLGPFRLLASGEIGANQLPPFAIQDNTFFYRDPSVVDADGDPRTLDVIGYFAGVEKDEDPNAPTDRIARFDAVDGRSFPVPGTVVLTPTLDWMDGHVGAPSAVRTPSGIFLYVETGGGIALATSADGASFEFDPEPLLDGSSPSVVQLADGTFDMFFEVDGPAILEATSPDGHAFTLASDAPVLTSAGSPCAVQRASEEGRPILDVYFTAPTKTGAQIGIASRFLDGADRALERSSAILLAPNALLDVREPSVIRFDGFTLLFATENASRTSTKPSVIAGLAPATFALPPASPP